MLGFRLHFSKYPTEYPEYFRIVDLRKGKQIDDGYHAIHLYYQRIIWHIPSKFNYGVLMTISLIYGAIALYINIEMPKLVGDFMKCIRTAK